MAALLFLGSVHEVFFSLTNWTTVAVMFGFACMALAFTLIFEFLFDLENQFVQLTKVLSETFMQLAKIDQQREDSHRSKFIFTFSPSGSTINPTSWNGFTEDARLDLLSLEQLEQERKRAEKEEDYEKAAKIQKKIEDRKSQH